MIRQLLYSSSFSPLKDPFSKFSTRTFFFINSPFMKRILPCLLDVSTFYRKRHLAHLELKGGDKR